MMHFSDPYLDSFSAAVWIIEPPIMPAGPTAAATIAPAVNKVLSFAFFNLILASFFSLISLSSSEIAYSKEEIA